MSEAIIAALLLFTLAREWQNARNTQRLIDKLMSRNYYDYEVSKKVSEEPIQETKLDLQLQPIEEDLSELNSIVR